MNSLQMECYSPSNTQLLSSYYLYSNYNPQSPSNSSISTVEEGSFQKEKVSCPFSLAKESKKEFRKLSHEQIKAKYKTELCKYYELNLGYCKFGDNVNLILIYIVCLCSWKGKSENYSLK